MCLIKVTWKTCSVGGTPGTWLGTTALEETLYMWDFWGVYSEKSLTIRSQTFLSIIANKEKRDVIAISFAISSSYTLKFASNEHQGPIKIFSLSLYNQLNKEHHCQQSEILITDGENRWRCLRLVQLKCRGMLRMSKVYYPQKMIRKC